MFQHEHKIDFILAPTASVHDDTKKNKTRMYFVPPKDAIPSVLGLYTYE